MCVCVDMGRKTNTIIILYNLRTGHGHHVKPYARHEGRRVACRNPFARAHEPFRAAPAPA